jgi:DNA-binding CsgD family transcriptional regulator
MLETEGGTRIASWAIGRMDESIPRPASISRVLPAEAIAVWRALLCGRWSVVDRFDDSHGRRFVLAHFVGGGTPRPWHRLSPRERTIVAAVAGGHSNAQIASQLSISVSTVAGHLRSARRKLGGARRVDLVREWKHGGLG